MIEGIAQIQNKRNVVNKTLIDLLEVSEIGPSFLYHRQREQVQRE
jgi:hypothetical protein